jgi:hypothetical protein
MLPATIPFGPIDFHVTPNAMLARGRTLPLPAGVRRVFVLAAADGDQAATFRVGDRASRVTVQDWTGFIGQWDTRKWERREELLPPRPDAPPNAPQRKSTADAFAGLTPGFIKPAPVAWFASHRRDEHGANVPYAYAYLFAHAFDVPAGAKTLTLPDNDRIRIMAVTTSKDPSSLATIEEAEATVTIERGFLPPPQRDDAAANAKITVMGGTIDANSAALHALVDGALPTDPDEPSANVFFRANSWGGRLRFDLGQSIDIAAIRTYSWHPDTRAPQVYKVYASNTDSAPASTVDPVTAGWKLIAFVDTRPAKGDVGGRYTVNVAGVGTYRYLLFDVFETESDDAWGNTFYSEVDVIAK